MRYIKLKKYILILISGLLATGYTAAQQTVVKASIDSTSILIGEQTLIHLEFATDKGKSFTLPTISDTIIAGIEIVGIPKPDTLDIGNNRMQIKQDYLITSFDSSMYLLPPFMVISGNDTSYSNTLGLKVSTLPVDTVSQQFYDIKGVIEPEFVWTDYLSYILMALAVILLALLIWFIVDRRKRKKPLLPFKKDEIILPPHVRAINELDEIKSQKLWQQGRMKEYHSQVTDTLRSYIEERFKIAAMEMTSGEILGKIRHMSNADSVYDNLKQILQLSDFVKFAKYHPLPDENELSLMNAYLFVNQTKIEEKPVVPEKEKADKEIAGEEKQDIDLKQSDNN